MSEGGDNDSSGAGASGMSGGSGGPNVRGGPSSGATKLTDAATKLTDNQACQCWIFFKIYIHTHSISAFFSLFKNHIMFIPLFVC
jgi:hypothetical protein